MLLTSYLSLDIPVYEVQASLRKYDLDIALPEADLLS